MTVAAALRSYARVARYQLWAVDALRYRGDTFNCPICSGSFRELKPFVGSCHLRGILTDHGTANAVCPRCHSGIRQRFIAAYLQQRTDLFTSPSRVLHFAPEIGLYQLLRTVGHDYVAADIDPSHFAAAVAIDITAIPSDVDNFDYIICIHVLEHIANDRDAIAELYRVLKPGGQAFIAVPTYGDVTFEDPTLDYAGRHLQYGTGDHLRLNGLDISTKLEAAGFVVQVVAVDDVPGNYVDRTVRSPHTESDRFLFHCSKPQAQ